MANAGDLVWLISSECPELIESLPMLMRDPKDLDVVLKTDKGQAKLEQDVSEAARYGLKSMLRSTPKPFEVETREKVEQVLHDFGATQASITHTKIMYDHKKKTERYRRQYT